MRQLRLQLAAEMRCMQLTVRTALALVCLLVIVCVYQHDD